MPIPPPLCPSKQAQGIPPLRMYINIQGTSGPRRLSEALSAGKNLPNRSLLFARIETKMNTGSRVKKFGPKRQTNGLGQQDIQKAGLPQNVQVQVRPTRRAKAAQGSDS